MGQLDSAAGIRSGWRLASPKSIIAVSVLVLKLLALQVHRKPLERTVRDDHHLAQVRLLREADVVRLRWRHPVLHDLMQNARFADTIGADQGIHIVWQWVVGLELQFERRDIPADIVKLESKVEHRGSLALQDPPAIEKIGRASCRERMCQNV